MPGFPAADAVGLHHVRDAPRDGQGRVLFPRDAQAEPVVPRHAAGEVLRGVAGDDLALVDDEHPAADGLDLGKDVGAQDDRMLLAQGADEIARFDDLLRVEADGRLVQDQDGRRPDQGLRNAHALFVALGEVLDEPSPHVGDLRHVHGPFEVLLAARAGDPLDVAHEGEIVADGHVHVQRRKLGHVPDLLLHLLRLLEDVVPVELHRSLRGGQIPGDDVHRGRFAGAVRTEEPEDFTPVHGEIKAVDGHSLAIFLRDVLDLYQGVLLSLRACRWFLS